MKRLLVAVFAAVALAAGGGLFAQGMGGGGMMGGGSYGGGMMGGGAYGGGMMGGSFGAGMMGGGMMGGGMMGAWDYIPPGPGKPLSLDEAAAQAQKYLVAWGNDDLQLSEVMEFSNHFYVEVAEKGAGMKAFELLLNKYTGAIFPEPGPNMMWNLKYGAMVSGMMGGLSQPDQAAKMPVTTEKAHELAQKALDAQGQGLKVEGGADQFYGYYTLHVLKDGKTYGMLGVNAFTGQVWLHTWHGRFIRIKEFEAMK